MRGSRFEELADHVAGAVPDGLGFTFDVAGEASDFVRFNHARVRQAGSVEQAEATVRLVDGSRHASRTVTLTGQLDEDQATLSDALQHLAELLPALPEDPHLLLSSQAQSTATIEHIEPPEPEAVVRTVCQAGEGTDLVGIYAGGSLFRGFANHFGQYNWFRTGGTLFDYSLVASADKAVKASVGGKHWNAAAIERSIAASRTQLEPLSRASRTVKPGSYRAYLAPAAVESLAEMFEWGGFSERGYRTKVSPLHRLIDGEVTLSDKLTMAEDTAGGMGPNFQGEGFLKPDQVPLITAGKYQGSLISPRSAAEYGLQPNGAGRYERPDSLAMAGGDLPDADVLSALGTGVYVSNLWYLNFSDRNAARVTGMTRFATFWVEDGKLVAPLSVMRFDASLFDLFGDSLEALTESVAFLPSASTYGMRSTRSLRVPGALVSALPFTL